jgi:hypothetical protein
VGGTLQRTLADAGYKGHNAPRVYTAGQKREMTDAIKRQMRRRSTIESVIGHAKNESETHAVVAQAAASDRSGVAAVAASVAATSAETRQETQALARDLFYRKSFILA